MRMLLLCALCLCGSLARGQDAAPVWRPLNDSVFTVLGLSDDQRYRIRTIDAQYEQERMKLNSSTDEVSRVEMERRLSGLIADREKEIQGVMNRDQFGAWVGTKPSAPPKKEPAKARAK